MVNGAREDKCPDMSVASESVAAQAYLHLPVAWRGGATLIGVWVAVVCSGQPQAQEVQAPDNAGARLAQTEIVKNKPTASSATAVPQKSAEPAPEGNEAAPKPDGPAVVTDVRLSVKGTRTVFEMAVSRVVPHQVFTLASPYRVVVDIPDLEFQIPADQPGAGRDGTGLVQAFRYGLFAAGRSRIVIDAKGPVRVVRSAITPADGDGPTRLALEMEATSPEAFRSALALTPKAGWSATTTTSPPAEVRPNSGKFVVMIDPGHGGIDGGAISGSHVLEKDIVLAVALKLKTALEQRTHFDVRMTRSSDTFISLDQRVALSEAAGADLFISIHADSVGDAALANKVHGTTIYTLSETASNQAAQLLADKENAADAASGISASGDSDHGQVNSILADLAKRETQNFSMKFRSLLIDRLRPTTMLAKDPARSAAFRVLRQVQTPTVLIELGFLSHVIDAQQMQTTEWQKGIAGAVAAAVDNYVAKRPRGER